MGDFCSFMTIGLFLGRFQPFHKGHLHVIEGAVKEVDELKIAIGSSQEYDTDKNPFSADEREGMINEVLMGKRYFDQVKFYHVPDIFSDGKYVEHLRKITGDFDVVYAAENLLTKKLFKEAGCKVITCERMNNYSSTTIREHIQNNKNWEHIVPEYVFHYIKKKKAEKNI